VPDDRADDDSLLRTETLIRLRHADCMVTLAQLAARIAHDVGTPLAVIAGRASMLASGQISGDAVVRSASIIAEQAERIRDGLQKLVELTRTRSAPTDRRTIRELVEQATRVLAPLSRARSMTVTIEGASGEAVPLVDGSLALQALTCLVAFAIERAPQGATIGISLEPLTIGRGADPRIVPGPHVCVKVSYPGVEGDEAVPPQALDLLQAAQPDFVGRYFGIAICDAIVRTHGGRTAFERADAAHNSTFHLPIQA
jgi:two-component system NtrC family sensor kinase